MEAHRLFIALPVDDEKSVKSLSSASEDLNRYRSFIKIVQPENYHLTLKFFGPVESEPASSLAEAFSAIGRLKKVDYSIEGIGAFPSTSTPSVIWAGIKCDKQPLDDIIKAVENLSSSFGFAAGKRKFVPHLTLARVKREKKVITGFKEYLDKEKNTFFVSSVFSELVLFESVLKNTGAEYKKISVLKLC